MLDLAVSGFHLSEITVCSSSISMVCGWWGRLYTVVLLESNRALLLTIYKITYVRHGGFGSNKRRLKSNIADELSRCCVSATWPSQGDHSLGGRNPDSNSPAEGTLVPTLSLEHSRERLVVGTAQGRALPTN